MAEEAPVATAATRPPQVGEDTPSFSEGLRNAMREDADVVLVGEMRDLETIALALTAAETGMLVRMDSAFTVPGGATATGATSGGQ